MLSAKLSGLGDIFDPPTQSSEQPVSSSLASTIRDIAQVVGQVYLTKEQMQAQQQILNIQLQRAQQNLPPLDIDLARYGLPQPSIGLNLTPQTQKLLLVIGGGLGLALLFGLIGGGRAARARH